MCGIVGLYHFDRHRPIDRVLFLRQNDALSHRGPDDGGVYVGDGVALGQRRLSIIDVSGGHQPMWDPELRLGIVFNGEIYNYKELRDHLEAKGHHFRSHSDTEVILASFREWGAACVEHFVGMFAFALLDRKERTVFLARDRLGKKPLFWWRNEGRVLFASELKSILLDPSVPRLLEPTAVADYYAYGYVPGPGTIFRDIQQLPPGHTMLIGGHGVSQHRYWDVDFSNVDETANLQENANRLIETLTDAVKLRLRSDVPLGAFLSGGVDSSLVVALMAGQLDRPVNTNTIGFTESEYDERAYAKETAELYGTQHHERVVAADAAGLLHDLSWFYDQPFGDSSAIPTYRLCQATREQVTVALSGDGGDESFAGYRRYVFALAEHEVRRRVPAVVRQGVVGPLARLYPKADFLPRPLRAKATLTNVATSLERAYFLSLTQKTYPRLLAKDFLRGLDGYDPYVHFERHLARAGTQDPLGRLQYVDLKTYLVDDILVKVDRASMAHALEVRVPLLDHRVVELAARTPSRYKLRGSETKVVLKAAAERLLPKRILEREKRGFVVPLPEWFRGALRGPAEEILFDRPGGHSGLLDTGGLRRLWYEHQLGVSNHATILWSVLMFEAWARRFLQVGVTSPLGPAQSRAPRPSIEASPA